MYALFGMICLVATPVFGAICLYNKATHKKDDKIFLLFLASFAILAICFALTPDGSSDSDSHSSSTAVSESSSEEQQPESESVSESQSEYESAVESQLEEPESESTEPESVSSDNTHDEIPVLDLDRYIKEYEDNAVRAKEIYGGKRYKVTYQVSSVMDAMMKVDNPYTVEFTVNYVTSHSIGYTVVWAGFPESEKSKIAKLSPGQTITFVGDFDGNRFTDCEFVN